MIATYNILGMLGLHYKDLNDSKINFQYKKCHPCHSIADVLSWATQLQVSIEQHAEQMWH